MWVAVVSPPMGPQPGSVGQVAWLSETIVAFAGAGRALHETAITFAGAKKFALLGLMVGVSAKKFALRVLMVGVSAKKFAQRTKNGSKLAFCGVLGELFRGNAAGRGVLGEFFRELAVV